MNRKEILRLLQHMKGKLEMLQQEAEDLSRQAEYLNNLVSETFEVFGAIEDYIDCGSEFDDAADKEFIRRMKEVVEDYESFNNEKE